MSFVVLMQVIFGIKAVNCIETTTYQQLFLETAPKSGFNAVNCTETTTYPRLFLTPAPKSGTDTVNCTETTTYPPSFPALVINIGTSTTNYIAMATFLLSFTITIAKNVINGINMVKNIEITTYLPSFTTIVMLSIGFITGLQLTML